MAKMYYEKDADLKLLKGKTIAFIGYGSQGEAQSRNLHESGLNVIVGIRKGSPSWKKAEGHGMTVVTPEEAAKRGDFIQVLAPDQVQREIYEDVIKDNLKPGNILGFSHGFNIHYSQILPPADVDVIMVAPKSPGHLVRRTYTEGFGVPALIAIEQNASGKAKDIALAYAKGIGSARAGVIETTFEEETETDLFGEQAVLCGGVSELIKAGFDTLTDAGYQPEIAYFECLHELKLIVDLIYEKGISGMRESISETAEYGDFTRGKRIITKKTRKEMKKILSEIQSGEFATEFLLENIAHRPRFLSMRKKEAKHLIEKVGVELRGLMHWIKK